MHNNQQNLLSIRNLNICVGTRSLVNNLTLSLKSGDRLAIIGEEGNGKSTLLKRMANLESGSMLDIAGDVFARGKIGYLSQNIESQSEEMTVREFLVFDVVKKIYEWEKFNNWRELEFLSIKLGIKKILDCNTKFNDVSGGEKVKICLLKIMMSKPDILLLDEPTNSLDIESIDWLIKLLEEFKGAVVVVSHEEYFLHKVANKILHLEQIRGRSESKCNFYNGTISDYLKRYEEKYQSELDEFYRQSRKKKEAQKVANEMKNKVRQQQENIKDSSARRLLNKKMKNVLSLQKNIARKFQAVKPQKEQNGQLKLVTKKMMTDRIWEVEVSEIIVGEKKLFGTKILRVRAGEKIFLIGRNGIGKSTLLRCIMKILCDRGVRVGFMDQNYQELVPAKTKILSLFEKIDQSVFDLLGKTNLSEWELRADWSDLSAGQKAKVVLNKIFMEDNDLLILDEPVRNLSIFSKIWFKYFVKNDQRAMIIVVHDWKMVNEMADVIWEIKNSEIELG